MPAVMCDDYPYVNVVCALCYFYTKSLVVLIVGNINPSIYDKVLHTNRKRYASMDRT